MKLLPIQKELRKHATKENAKQAQYYFKTGEGQYGHGDVFIGVRTKPLRDLAQANTDLSLTDTKKLVRSIVHEDRILGLLILVYRYKKSKDDKEKTSIYKSYLTLFKYVNNWDLVDCSCPYIVGAYLLENKSERKVLAKWAKSDHIWTRRIAMVSNWWLIRKGDLGEVFKIAKILLKDEEDLIHKAVGWMLREAGKKDLKKLEIFLKQNYSKIPRTALRYAIEKFPEAKRKRYLKGKI